jgi:hypothetical protein
LVPDKYEKREAYGVLRIAFSGTRSKFAKNFGLKPPPNKFEGATFQLTIDD